MDRISDVAQGPGWWLASDGRWYPPEAHPAAQHPAAQHPASPLLPTDPPAVPPPLPRRVPAPPGRGPAGQGTAWGADYWSVEGTFASRRRPSGARPSSGFRRPVDQRGAFVAVLSLLLLLGCVLPYYRVASAGSAGLSSSQVYDVMASAFGSWRAAVPALAVLAAAFGVANSVLRVGSRGAVGVFVTLRVLAFVQLGLWVLVAFDRRAQGVAFQAHGALAAPTTTVTWVAWAAIAAAAAALAGSFASMAKTGPG